MSNVKTATFTPFLADRQPDFERLVTTLRRQEPDRVPFAEFIVEEDVKAAFLGKKLNGYGDEIEFWYRAGYDFFPISINLVKPGRAIGGQSTGSYSVYPETYTERSWAEMHKGVITTCEEFDAYVWPEIGNVEISALDDLEKLLPDGMKVIVVMGKIFSANWLFQGAETFYMNVYDNPELIEKLYEKITSLQYAVFERVIDRPIVGGVWHADDMAGTAGLLLDAAHFRKYVFPWYKKMGAVCRQLDKPMIFHSDGNVETLMEDIIEAGFWGLHPIDPKAMDINDVMRRYGDRIALIGNTDMEFPLGTGTPEDVKQLIRQRISELAPGGGYVVSSGNSVAEYIPLDNYKAMLWAGHTYGKYPISC